jgi:hypothetical protein
LLVHACDLSGQTMKPALSAEWGRRVICEFRKQVQQELANGLPVAPFMEVCVS